jgi:putative sterol carrier protein
MTAIEHIDAGLPAAFVWDYDDRRPRLGKLYEKSKVSQWNASTDLDWDTPVDPGELPRHEMLAGADFGDDIVLAKIGRTDENVRRVVAEHHGWLVSQFMHGEQGALVATARICAGADTIDDKYYAAAQVADEARHVEAYQRYLDLVDLEYPVSDSLHELLEQVMRHRDLDLTFLGMQILVEGVALAAFSLGPALFANPLIGRITELVRRDEARHVAFGVLSLQGRYDDMDPVDLRVREDFVLEACALMRDRFMPVQVWERFGIDVAEGTAAFSSSPDAMAFRSLLFSKVVPNLRKLGLLTSRVREGFEQMGILRYERYVDSATEAGEIDPDDGDLADPLTALRAQLGGVEVIAPEPVLMVLAGVADRSRLVGIPRAAIRLTITGLDDQPGDFVVEVGDGDVAYRAADATTTADATVRMDAATWTDIIAGRVSAPGALIEGRIGVEGDLGKAMALEALL